MRGEHNGLYGALLVQRNLCFVAGRDAGCVEHLRPSLKRAIAFPVNAKLRLQQLGISTCSRFPLRLELSIYFSLQARDLGASPLFILCCLRFCFFRPLLPLSLLSFSSPSP